MLVSPTSSISSLVYVMKVNKGLKKFMTVDIQFQFLAPEEVVESLASI